jgi:hypothetical protein
MNNYCGDQKGGLMQDFRNHPGATMTLPDGWISASRTRNFLLDDPILDWLSMHGRGKGHLPDNERLGFVAETDFSSFIMSKGKAFEAAVLAHLRQHEAIEFLETITTTREEIGSENGVQRTIEAMKRGTPIIAQGTLRDDRTRTYGAPDLLVRSDVLLRLVPTVFDPEIEWLKKQKQAQTAGGIAGLAAPSLGSRFHYRVVDIKFTGLHLDQFWHAGNSGSSPAYKGQVWLYNQMLEQAQGYLPPSAFLLGRSFEKGSGSKFEEGRRCLDRLAPVFVDAKIGKKRSVEETTLAGLEWLRRCKMEGAKWEVNTDPSVHELRPNMKNDQDQPWHRAKSEIATSQKELTQLWRVGLDLRNNAIAGEVRNGDRGFHPAIKRADDPNLSSKTIGLTGPTYAPVLDAMLAVQRGEHPVRPARVTANAHEWSTPKKLELFVDFETVSDLNDDFSAIPERGGQALIFMVGLGYFAADGGWVFECFVADSLTVASERQMLDTFFAKVNALCAAAAVDLVDACVFHWSHAEESTLDTALRSARHRHPQATWPQISWYDFLTRVVKEEPVVVRGAMGFGLKAIGKALHKHGLIKTSWADGPTDGLGAMVAAWQASEQIAGTANPLMSTSLMLEVRQYNEVDCRVMAEVIGYIRGTSAH